MPDTSDQEIPIERLQTFSDEFDDLCQMRHEMGAQQYGELNFLNVDLFRYAAEEIADLANYSRMLYVKLRTIEELLNASGINLSAQLTEEVRSFNPVPSDPSSFIPSSKVSRFLPNQK